MNKCYSRCILLLFLALNYQGIAQQTMLGRVLDAKSLTPLPYPTVVLNDTIIIATDGGGFYIATLDQISSIMVSYIGYDTVYSTIVPPSDTFIFDIKLKEITSLLGTVVVTGTNYAKSILEEPTSIEVIKTDFIQNNNITGLDKIIERVPGIQIQDGQASIRSSGFSQGTGSRVGLIVDGMPMLAGDNSSIQWNFIPIENIDQVEVIKGASSVLYGSAAMNGVINVRTAMPTSEPYTNITLYSGMSDSPKEAYRQWWTTTFDRPRNHGVFISHRQKFGKTDVVLGGNMHRSIGHIQGENEERIRLNGKVRYRANDKLNFTLDANLMAHSFPSYLSWADGDTNVLRPLSPLDNDEYNNNSIALTMVYYGNYQIKHTLRGRWNSGNFISGNGASFPISMKFGEYQAQKNFGEQFILSAGASHQQYAAQSLIFGTDSLGITPDFKAGITSFYAQGDFNAFDKRLNVIGGVRWELINAGVEDYGTIPPIFRLSSTFKMDSKNILRMNAGQGYRFPSLYERFADIVYQSFSLQPLSSGTLDFGIMPNPTLRPEYGWSAEVGYKHVLNIRNWNGYLDIAAFAMRYKDMIYLTLDYHKDLGRQFYLQDLILNPEPFGYKFININNTLVAGVEVGANLNGQIGKLPFRLWAGYTYTYPGDLDSIQINDESYLENFFNAFIINDGTETNSMLTYRSTHVARLDIEWYWKPLTFGFSTIMDGYMHKIDPLLEGDSKWSEFIRLLGGDILPGVIDYRAANPGNNWSFDAKLAYKVSDKHQLHFIVNNILNTTYATRPGRINPLRGFNIKYSLTL
jgi:outer membrane receptor for ferrienterochelin and colicin